MIYWLQFNHFLTRKRMALLWMNGKKCGSKLQALISYFANGNLEMIAQLLFKVRTETSALH